MKKFALLLVLLCACLLAVAAAAGAAGPAAPAADDAPLVTAKVLHSQAAYAQGGSYPLAIALTIRPGWHINADRPREKDLYPTAMLLQCSADCGFSPAAFPKPRAYQPGFSKTPLDVFDGTVIVRTTLTVTKNAQVGPQLLGARLMFQGCDDSACAMPEDLEVPIQVKIAPAGQAAAPLNQEIFRSK
ncbi:MAG: protein-disulfide reductase DsbD domain-containing protein [Pseudomonadota bacterium]